MDRSTTLGLRIDRYIAGFVGLRGFLKSSQVTTPNLQLSYIHSFSPTILNDFRAGYAGNGNHETVNLPGVPQIVIDDGTLGFGSGSPLRFHENIYTYADMVLIEPG